MQVFKVILLILTVFNVNADVKVWMTTKSLADKNLWKNGRIPCPGQKIALAEDVIFVPDKFNFGQETILPQNGKLVFPQDGEVKVSEATTDSSCQASQNFSTSIEADFDQWHDPKNWASVIEFADDEGYSAVPHSERVPCDHDEALFPSNAVFKVAIENHPAEVTKLMINGIDLDSIRFRSLLYSPIGRMTFKATKPLIVNNAGCRYEEQGCVCRQNSIDETICAMPGSKCPDTPQCSSALRPKGHCCYDICGSVITIQTSGLPFNMVNVKEMIAGMLKPPTPPPPRETSPGWLPDFDTIAKYKMSKKERNPIGNNAFHISRIGHESYQIIIVNKEKRTVDAVQAGRKILDWLQKDYKNNPGIYMWHEESGTAAYSPFRKASNIFGILFIIGTIAAFLYFVTTGYRKKRPGAVLDFISRTSVSSISGRISNVVRGPIQNITTRDTPFARFDTTEQGVEIEPSPSAPLNVGDNSDNNLVEGPVSFRDLQRRVGESNVIEEVSPRRFDNPMFDQTPKPKAEPNIYAPDPVTIFKKCKTTKDKNNTTTVENPMYDVMVDIAKEASKENDETETKEEAIYWEVGEDIVPKEGDDVKEKVDQKEPESVQKSAENETELPEETTIEITESEKAEGRELVLEFTKEIKKNIDEQEAEQVKEVEEAKENVDDATAIEIPESEKAEGRELVREFTEEIKKNIDDKAQAESDKEGQESKTKATETENDSVRQTDDGDQILLDI